MAQPTTPGDEIDMHFPVAGIDLSTPFGMQRPRRVGGKSEYGRTARLGENVRANEPAQDRRRGGSRAGLVRYIDAQVTGDIWLVQMLAVIVSTDAAAQP